MKESKPKLDEFPVFLETDDYESKKVSFKINVKGCDITEGSSGTQTSGLKVTSENKKKNNVEPDAEEEKIEPSV